MRSEGTLKGAERVTTGYLPPAGKRGPRWLVEGEGNRLFLRMNSNSYLGLSLEREVVAAGEEASRRFGAGPGAVRFISGTCLPHVQLEERLADFHGREAAMIFNSAYGAVMGVLPPLVTPETAVFSDELNHNCIINALRVSRPAAKVVYRHLDTETLRRRLEESARDARRAIVVSDGIFSMRGNHAPLDEIAASAGTYAGLYTEGVLTVLDDSHGVGAIGRSGRGTEEETGARADILVATLGKALGVNGGYAVSSRSVIDFLREKSPFYIYSNPISPGEAAAAVKSLEILLGPRGAGLLERLRSLTQRFREGLAALGCETIEGKHPIVPLMVRDTARTRLLVQHLFERGILATGVTFPVVPRGDEEVRFQVSAAHTEEDIDLLLDALEAFGKRRNGSPSGDAG